jgi:hypothetical protein
MGKGIFGTFFVPLNTAGDFRTRHSDPRGGAGASSASPAGSPAYRYLPQDKEGFGSDTSHEENARIFEESSPIAPITS